MSQEPSAETADRDGPFVQLGPRDNFYQSCAFLPLSFALVTTLGEDGRTNIGPHALCFPFNITDPYAMLLISRASSATAANIHRTGRCALNYIEFDERHLAAVARLGYPGQSVDEKRQGAIFNLDESPSSHPSAVRPRIVREAFQVFECTWDDTMDVSMASASAASAAGAKFVLRIDDILLRRGFWDGVEQGRRFPSMPIFMGFRAGREFWFASHGTPFPVAAPQVAGTELQSVLYLANRLDERVRFTAEACAKLTRVPRPFLQAALERLIAGAHAQGITLIDHAFIESHGGRRPSALTGDSR